MLMIRFPPGPHVFLLTGIINMKHRATLLGATIEWNTKPGHGTAIHIVLPAQP